MTVRRCPAVKYSFPPTMIGVDSFVAVWAADPKLSILKVHATSRVLTLSRVI
jgi:hypothetical protein